jgi:hypothetical protein
MHISKLNKINSGFAPILIIIGVVLLISLVLAFTMFSPKNTGKKGFIPNPTPTLTPMPTAEPNPYIVSIADWKTYTNTQFGFEFKHPKEFSAFDIYGKEATPSTPLVIGKIVFSDSNKNQFSVNIYPVSTNPSVNTTLNNLQEYTGLCGQSVVDRTIVSKVFTENGVSYKQVAQVDKKGRNITDFCFFSPGGNPVVFRNNVDSTVIAMKQIISTLLFSGQTDTSGRTLYINGTDSFSVKFPKDFTLSAEAKDFVPPHGLPALIADIRKEGFKNEKSGYSQVANFAVSSGGELANCFTGLSGKVSLNGTDYKSQKLLNSATGHSVEGTVMRTVNGKCYEIQASIQSSLGSGDDSANIKAEIEVDRQKLQTQLDSILSTFTFLK